MRVTVAAWVGSSNLGDELVFAALLGHLRRRGADTTVISIEPVATRRIHDVEAIGHTSRHLISALRSTDAVVLGGGGLLQDRTSDLNLPYHLSRLWLAGRRPTVVGVGLGAGPLTTVAGEVLVRRTLPRLDGLSVRDEPSADVLGGLGLERPMVAADLAVSLETPAVESAGRLVVSLRPWSPERRRLPVQLRRSPPPERFVTSAAAAIDAAAKAYGLAPHLVALDSERDHALHWAVAARMRVPATLARPGVHDVVAEIATGDVVVAMRYHAAIAAVLAGRPAVLLGYDPKVEALAADLGDAGRLLPWADASGAVPAITGAVGDVTGHAPSMVRARQELRSREQRNGEVLRLID